MLRPQILQLIGFPPAYARHLDRYGDLQLFYRNQQLTMIYLDDFDRPTGTGQIQLETHGLQGGMSKASLLEFLQHCQIGYQFLDGSQPASLVTQAGVHLSFEPDDQLFALWLGSL